MKWIVLALLASAALAAACGGDDAKAKKSGTVTTVVAGSDASETAGGTTPAATGSSPATGGATAAPPSATKVPAPTQTGGSKTYSAKPPLTIDTNKKYFATIKMDIGDIKLELFAKDAPETVNSFVFLARDGYFDGLTFHRVIAGFVAQAGDPLGTGTGGPGYKLPDEVNKNKFIDGAVGMATSGPNTAGSQFFICFSPQPRLDGTYTVFGQVVEGRDVLNKIKERDPSLGGAPGTVMNTIVIEEQ
jgi:cyclophilin family peptidyl-prolyl cis-trans isomerase